MEHEHFPKYIKVGTSNDVILSNIRVKPGYEERLSYDHYKVIEGKLSRQLQHQLDETDPARPGILNTICGEIIMGDTKFVYNLRERRNLPVHLMVTGQARKRKQWKKVKEGHVDDSIFKYRNYGGLFMKQSVVRAELVVTIERLPLSDSQSWKNTPVGKENTDAKSAYFKGDPDVKAQTPQERKTLRHLFKEKDRRKRKLSSSDSENTATLTSKAKSRHQSSVSQHSRTTEESLARKVKKEDQRALANCMDSSQKEKQSSAEDKDRRSAVAQKVKESKGKVRDDETAATKLSTDKSGGKGTWKQREVSSNSVDTMPVRHFKSMTGGGCVSPFTSGSQGEPLGSQGASIKGIPEGTQKSADIRKASQKESQREKLTHRECRKDRVPYKEDRPSHQHKRDERTNDSQKEGKKNSKAEAPQEKPTKKSSLIKKTRKDKGEKLKKLLTDCGLSDSDSGNENTLKKEKKILNVEVQSQQMKNDRLSPLHALQRGSETLKESKRESLEDFDLLRRKMQKRTERVRKLKTSTSLCKSLLFASDDDDDEENMKKSNIGDEYNPSIMIKKEADRCSQDYSPTPVKKHVNEDDAYVPTTMKKAQKEDGAAPCVKPHLQPEEYIPTSISPIKSASPVNMLRGRYEEYVPQAITSTAQRQLHTIDYVPTPKKDKPQLYTPDMWQNALYIPDSPAAAALPCGGTSVVQLEEEIKSSRDVKELDDKHIKYLFYKCMPEMEGIIKKKICSWRNDDYHQGGKAKRMLTYKVYSSAFSDEQIDLISHMFIDEYVMRRNVVLMVLNCVLTAIRFRHWLVEHDTSGAR
ncbi:uncharacterized protein LOC135396666 isoform X2 [Ornithodoros turicata]|uniref:uncharacterized protein LOC135396666 isoform X2 n=2 Tax=Ornithodoros turicata TaxID=34597 RepID=UPI00313A2A53